MKITISWDVILYSGKKVQRFEVLFFFRIDEGGGSRFF
jgi:hypothetical protein